MEPDVFYLPLTRGARTRGGIPAGLFWLNLAATWVGYCIPGDGDITRLSGAWMWIGFGIVNHLILMRCVSHDPNMFRLMHKRMDAGLNRVHWSAPYRASARDVASAI